MTKAEKKQQLRQPLITLGEIEKLQIWLVVMFN